jgi:hypothetical protein
MRTTTVEIAESVGVAAEITEIISMTISRAL